MSTTTANTDQAALVRAIREHPEDDAPRLVYADWLEEPAQQGTVRCERCKGTRWKPSSTPGINEQCPCGTGEVSNGLRERAEFIRVQIELARLPDPMRCPRCSEPVVPQRMTSHPYLTRCSKCSWGNGPFWADTKQRGEKYEALRSRELDLLGSHAKAWFPHVDAWVLRWNDVSDFVASTGLVERGSLSAIRCPGDRLAAFVSAVCPDLWRVCEGIGEHHGDRCNGGRIQAPNAQFTRTCPTCHGTGRTDVPTEVWHMPVERIECTWPVNLHGEEWIDSSRLIERLNRHHPFRRWSLTVDGQTIEPHARGAPNGN